MDEKRLAGERGNARQMFLWLIRLEAARAKIGRRKLRLLACGIPRLWWDDLIYEVMRRGVEIAEQFADESATKEELAVAHRAACDLYVDRMTPNQSCRRTQRAAYLSSVCCEEKAAVAARSATRAFAVAGEQAPEVIQAEGLVCDLFRCVFGNPFQKPSFNKKWRSETVTALATGIYADRAFDRLPILADALEEAGCEDPAMLSHLRSSGPHCRGCWVLDLALGK